MASSSSPLPLPPLPERPALGHKGTFGTVCILGGQAAPPRVMVGGPALAALAALRAGAGLAELAMPAPILAAGLTVAPSATGLALPVDGQGRLLPSAVAEVLDGALGRVSCLGIGPGMGVGPAQMQIVLRLVARDELTMVIDADALNCLAEAPELQRDFRANAILTPHPGEFERLAASLGMRFDPDDQAARPEAATALASRLGCVVVLKGHHTVVSDGLRCWTCTAGNAAMATAGTGDVLTGVISSLVAQHRRGAARLSLFDCARLGVEAHARAGDRWAAAHGPGSAGLLAADLVAELPAALQSLRMAPDRQAAAPQS